MTDEVKPLTRKQRVFVAEYIQCWNASEAARRAGYSEKTAYAIGSELLRKPEIKAVIDACLAEIQMGADEAKARNTEYGRAYMGMFFKVSDSWMFNPPPSYEILDEKEVIDTTKEPPEKRISYRVRRVVLDMDKVLDPKHSRLIKKFTDSNRNGIGIELYSGQEANKDTLKMAGEYTDRVDVTTQGEKLPQAVVNVYLPDNGRDKKEDGH